MLQFIPLSSVRIKDAFYQAEQQLVKDVVIPYQWETLNDRVPDAEPSYCIRNFCIAAGQEQGMHGGAVFQDSDLYKWLEAVAYCLAVERDEKLEALADGAIELIEAAQEPDGYLDTYFTITTPGKRWYNLMEGHELYCAGHYIEAAVAYAQATGKRRCLDIATKLADCIDRAFGMEPDKMQGYGGHPEIELALVKLYKATGEERYLRLAQYFVDVRGAAKENWFETERTREGHHYIWSEMAGFGTDYFQAHKPVRDQDKAAGHAVRAMYLYSAMADLACINDDHELQEICGTLYDNVIHRQMYVTGGIGSASLGERFTCDFDLPNDTVYAETCASIGLMMLSQRMFALTADLRCYDVWERALGNAVLAGMGRDGRHFFYVNPLAVTPEFAHKNPTLGHVKTVRQKWFGCACCPPNLARTLASLGGSLYALDDSKLYVLAHIASSFEQDGMRVELQQNGEEYTLTVDAPPMEIVLRKPEGFTLVGETLLRHLGGHATYRYRLSPIARIVRADPRVAADAGKVCVMRGQTVYCLEEADNGKHLSALWLDTTAPIEEAPMDFLPETMRALTCMGYRAQPLEDGALYTDELPRYEPERLTFIPYSQWNNRGEGEMTVWVNAFQALPK